MALNVVIDLSHINAVKGDGITGVIHKATEGLGYVDPKYHARRGQALAAGLCWGAYHFGASDYGAVQAQHFLSAVNLGEHDLLVAGLRAEHGGR